MIHYLSCPLDGRAPLHVLHSLWECVAGTQLEPLLSAAGGWAKIGVKTLSASGKKNKVPGKCQLQQPFWQSTVCRGVWVTALRSMGTPISGNSPSLGYLHWHPLAAHLAASRLAPLPPPGMGCAVGGRQKAFCPRHTGWCLSSPP